MVICLERGADLHMAQLMPLPLTVSCFSEIQIGFTFLVLAHRVVPDKGPLNVRVCVCVCVCVCRGGIQYMTLSLKLLLHFLDTFVWLFAERCNRDFCR